MSWKRDMTEKKGKPYTENVDWNDSRWKHKGHAHRPRANVPAPCHYCGGVGYVAVPSSTECYTCDRCQGTGEEYE